MSQVYEKLFSRMIFQLAYAPRTAFAHLCTRSSLLMAVILLVVRFSVTVATTVTAMYFRASPMLLRPPFGLDEHTYRYYEIFWYGPYGVLTMLLIVMALDLIVKRVYHRPDVTYRKGFEIVSLAFFTPWLVTVPGDAILLWTVNAHPAFLVPFHIAVLAWECLLVYVGFQVVYGLRRDHAAMLGLVAGAVFLGLGGLLIR
jgi:hypothetical protein